MSEIKKSSKSSTSTKQIIDKNELATFIGDIIAESYGVVGLVDKKSTITSLLYLKRDNYLQGIEIIPSGYKYIVDVHVVLAYGLKISEIINEISKRLSYFLMKQYGDIFKKINVYIEDLKVL